MEPERQPIKVRYDSVMDGIRIAKARVRGFDVAFTCNTRTDEPRCTVKIEKDSPLYPDIQYAGGRFTLSYAYLVLTERDLPAFQAACREAEGFCSSAGPDIDRAVAMIEAGEPLA